MLLIAGRTIYTPVPLESECNHFRDVRVRCRFANEGGFKEAEEYVHAMCYPDYKGEWDEAKQESEEVKDEATPRSSGISHV